MDRKISELVKSLSQVVLKTNSDILDLAKTYSKSEAKKDDVKEKVIEKEVKTLEDAIKSLEAGTTGTEYVSERFVSSLKNTVQAAKNMLEKKSEPEEEIHKAEERSNEIKASVDEVIEKDKKAAHELKVFSDSLAGCLDTKTDQPLVEDSVYEIESAIADLEPYVRDRFNKLKNHLTKQMSDQVNKLEKVWKDEKDNIDLAGLKEVKFEFDQVDRKMKHLLNEWDKRKYSDILSDHLLDLHDKLFDEYFEKYTSMADIKRSEALSERKREKEMLLYKNEKRRAIPTWPKEVPYSKFKPDLISWDKEHFMTSSSSKFGLMLEMLKKEDRSLSLSNFKQD